MKRDKINTCDTDLLNEYYKSDYPQSAGLRIRGLFSRWLFGRYSDAGIERALDEVWDAEELDPNMWDKGRAEVDKILSRVTLPDINVRRSLRSNLVRATTRIAAVVIPIMVVAGGFWWYSARQQTPLQAVEYVVAHGASEKITLEDNTQVWINAGSKVTHPQGKAGERILELDGEGYFNVTKDPQRPFTVKTADMQIKVLGTQFNVASYPDRSSSTITLNEGAVVIVLNDGRSWSLEPSQQFVYDRQSNIGNVISLSKYETQRNAEWRDGKLICDLITIPEILKSVERKYGLTIEIDPSVSFSSEKYIMEFRADDTPEFILDWLKQLEDRFSYKVRGKQVTLTALAIEHG